LNAHRACDVRQIEVHTADSLVPYFNPFEVENAIAKLENYKSPGSDHILVEMIQANGEILRSEILNSLILFGIRKDFLIIGRSLLLYHFKRRAIKLTVVIIFGYHCY
jgi:hypothetical protein